MIIDTDNYEAAGIEVFTFPGGEWHANLPKWPYATVNVHAKIRTWNDFGALQAVLSALYGQGVSVHLFMPYLPGARQDRNPGGLTPDTPTLYGNNLRGHVRSVTVADPHSTVSVSKFGRALDNRPVHILAPELYLPSLLSEKYDYIVQPDEGAAERTKETAAILGIPESNILVCKKKRNFQTGKLEGFEVPQRFRNIAHQRILIPDDICDGGGTFLGLLQAFEALNDTNTFDLFVTHGIFSNGATNKLIVNGFDHVYTTDSWHRDEGDGDVTTQPLLPYYLGGLHP